MKNFPEHWDVKELRNVNIEIIDGDRGVNYPKQSEFLSEGHCLFLNTGNIKKDTFVLDYCNFVSEARDNLLRQGKLRRKDIVLTTRGTVGSVAYYSSAIPYEHIRINSGMVILRCGDGLNTHFIYQLLKSPTVKEQYRLFSSGSAQPQLPIKDLKKVPLVIPPLPVQQKIAAILTVYDDLVENNSKRISLLEKSAEEIYREWFVRMRFPGWQQVKFEKGIPEEWETGAFTDFIDVMSGGTPKTEVPQYWGDEIPWFTPRDLKDSLFIFDTERKITEDGLRHCASKLYPPNTIFITARGTVGNCVMNAVPMAMSQTSYALLGKNNLPQYFIYYLTLNMVTSLRQQATGAVFDTIVVDTFRKQKVVLPSKPILDQFIGVVSPLLEQLKLLQQQNEKLKKSRDLLLPRLISGKLPVDDLEIEFPPSMMKEKVTDTA
jgi:type I restriction enzyme, S subunit